MKTFREIRSLDRFRAIRDQLQTFERLAPASQGQDPALTVLSVPRLLSPGGSLFLMSEVPLYTLISEKHMKAARVADLVGRKADHDKRHQHMHRLRHPALGPLPSEKGTRLKGPRTLTGTPRPESGLDCHMCAKLTRHSRVNTHP